MGVTPGMEHDADHRKEHMDDMELLEEMDFEQKRYSFTAGEKEQITAQLKEFLQKRPEIRFAFLHGSFIDEFPCRDIDIGIYFEPELDPETIFDLALDLSVELTSLLHAPVDVHSLNQAGNGFCYHVTRGLLLVSRDDEETYDFMEKTWRNYLDFQPLARQILYDLLR